MTELIKTRKQYDETLDFLKINRFAYDEANEIDDLIEALREVVRAGKAIVSDTKLGSVPDNQIEAMGEIIASLPDWIKEDG